MALCALSCCCSYCLLLLLLPSNPPATDWQLPPPATAAATHHLLLVLLAAALQFRWWCRSCCCSSGRLGVQHSTSNVDHSTICAAKGRSLQGNAVSRISNDMAPTNPKKKLSDVQEYLAYTPQNVPTTNLHKLHLLTQQHICHGVSS